MPTRTLPRNKRRRAVSSSAKKTPPRRGLTRTGAGAKDAKPTFRPWARVPPRALVDFTRSFAVLIQARLSLIQSLETAAAQCSNATLKQVIETIRRDVQRGKSLADSLARHERVFNSLYVHLAHIGEVAGILDRVLLRLSEYLEKASTLKRKIQFALLYPVLILAVSMGAITFFLVEIVPTFAEMYADFGRELPGPTQVVLRLSEVLTEYALVVLIGLSILVVGGGMVLRSPGGRLAWDRVKLRLPLFGMLMRKSLTARFCRTLGTLLASGVALVDALSILTKASGNQYIERTLAEVLRRVRRGSSLFQPLKQAEIFPDMVVQLIAVGEQTAELDTMLLHAAGHYEHEVDTFLDGLTAIIEPILIVVIGFILGGILISLYLPLFEMMNTVG